MTTDPLRRSKQDKFLEGTIKILKDNKEKIDIVNKLVYFIECLKTAPMNENDIVKTMTMCKDYLKRSYDFTKDQ